ncbi:MAG: hypothetical protein PVJ98_08435 [Akkermansiaceae bacterium]|jgi:hypothetical protein
MKLSGMLALVFALPTSFSSAKDDVISEILPSPAESAWLEIDWKTDLWEARQEAARMNKPIYLWEMDGHPLGCV